MKFLLLAATCATANALILEERSNSGTVGLPIYRNPEYNALTRHRRLMARDSIFDKRSSVQITLDNLDILYFANLTVGTPPQSFRTHIDTGSSDLWLNAASSSFCRRGNCRQSGTYDSSASSTYKRVNTQFNISYADGSGASGDYVTDSLRIGSASLNNFQFGVGLTSSSAQAVLGIGYRTLEAGYANKGLDTYQNLPYAMVDAGLIASPAYSLWLNDLDSAQGNILFGGVDTEKYVGSLATVDILSYRGQSTPSVFIITLTGITQQHSGTTTTITSSAFPVVLDSGSTLCLLPESLADRIFSIVGATYDDSLGVATIPCSSARNSDSFTFDFSGKKISVPMDEMVIELRATDGSIYTDRRGNPQCMFGIGYTIGGVYVLGDTFLRSAYVVYDLGNDEISLAQTNFNATRSNVVSIGTGPNAVPNASGVANQVTATATATFSGVNGVPTRTGLSAGVSATAASTNRNAAVSLASNKVALWAGFAALAYIFS